MYFLTITLTHLYQDIYVKLISEIFASHMWFSPKSLLHDLHGKKYMKKPATYLIKYLVLHDYRSLFFYRVISWKYIYRFKLKALTWNLKFVDSLQQFTHQAKIQMLTAFCSIVKLIPWNLVNLSHLYNKDSS